AAGCPCLVTVTLSWVRSTSATSSDSRLRASANDISLIAKSTGSFSPVDQDPALVGLVDPPRALVASALPARYSPSGHWIWPACPLRSTPWRATTPPRR